MAATYGRLWGLSRDGLRSTPSTRQGHGGMECRLETWEGSVVTTLDADGSLTVELARKDGSGGQLLLGGNVDTGRIVGRNEGSPVREATGLPGSPSEGEPHP